MDKAFTLLNSLIFLSRLLSRDAEGGAVLYFEDYKLFFIRSYPELSSKTFSV